MNRSKTLLFVNFRKAYAEEIIHSLGGEPVQFLQCKGFGESLQMARLYMPNIFVILEAVDGSSKGMKLVRDLRANSIHDRAQIMYVALEDTEEMQMQALQAGADDMLPESVSIRILSTRIATLIKRFSRSGQRDMLNEEFDIDPESMTATLGKKKIQLVRKEFELLHLLYSHPNKIFSRQEILHHIWNQSILKNGRTLDVHIRKLRVKLGTEHIKTVIGVGYKFEWPRG